MDTKKKQPRHNLARFFAYAGKYRALIILAALAGVIRYLIPLVMPWTLKVIVDEYLAAPGRHVISDLHVMMGTLIALYGVYAFVSYYRIYFAGLAGNRVTFDLRQVLYLHLQRMSLGFFERKRIGEVVNRMTSDIASAHNIIGTALVNTAMDVSFIFVVLAVLTRVHWKLALVSFSVIPFYAWSSYVLIKKIRAKSKVIHQKHEEISGELHEQFSAISTIQAFTQEDAEAKAFQDRNQDHLDTIVSNTKLQAVALGATGFLTALGPILVLWFGVTEVWTGRLTAGTLLAFYTCLGLLYGPIQRLTELNLVLANSMAAIGRIFEMLDTYSEVREKEKANVFARVRGDIAFERVSFKYNGQGKVYSDFSASIPAGMNVALVGPSGAGKSTLAKLLLRFYDVEGGRITIDGVDVRDATLQSLRRQIAFVSQEPILLSGTISENLRYGNVSASPADMKRAARDAFADRFIESLPHAYETEIGERGLRLSGGERQRLAIARAFLKNAPILVMDEPTSALDAESEELIKEATQRLLQGRTSIIIAHRLSTIEHVDRILVLDQGRLIENGRHEDLIQNPAGLYRKYLEAQISFYLGAS